jgi:hypothetical protein
MRRPNPFPSSAAIRSSRTLAALLIGLFMLPGRTQPEASAPSPSAAGDVLLQAGHLVYEGAFRLPANTTGSTFDGGGRPMTFDPAKGTLLIAGISQQQIAEVSIPAIRTGASLSDLATATVVTPFKVVVNFGGLNCSEAKLTGGILQWGGDLISSAYCYFEGGTEKKSHHRNGVGPVQVGTIGAGYVSAWMAPIPTEWRAAFGGPALTGQGSIPIISRTSSGPAASVFNPADVGVLDPVPATPVVGYPYNDSGTWQTLGRADSDGTLWSSTQHMGGMVFPPGTSSVLFFAGRKAKGPFCYGNGTPDQALHGTDPDGPGGEDQYCWDPVNTDKGTHGYPYAHFVYAYDANELVAVKNGQKQPWQVVPYATWEFDVPFQHGQRVIEGVAYDPATKRIYLTAGNGDGYKPLVHVFTVDAAASVTTSPEPTPSAPAPLADTEAPSVTITAPASGTVVTGSVTIGATASDNVAVAGVQFTLDGANLGGEDTGAPYQAMWDTTAVSNGSHTLRAIARDSAGNASSSPVTISVNNVSTLPDSTAPTVALVSPDADTTVTGTTILSATASDNVGVTAVQFTLNNASLGEPVGAPFQWSWVTSTVPDGAYTLRAVARDAAGNSTQSASRNVTVSNGVIADPGDDVDGTDGWSAGDGGRGRQDGVDKTARVKPGRNRTASSDLSSDSRPIAGTERVPRTSGSADSPTSGARGSLARMAGRRGAAASATDTQSAPVDAPLECQGENPFQSSAGRIGICVGGQWTAVLGIRTWGVVRQRSLPSGATIWVIETDEALYEVHGGLAEAYRKQDLEILFEGWFRTDLKSPLEGASVLELRQISVP